MNPNPRAFLNWFKTKTGNQVLFYILVGITCTLLGGYFAIHKSTPAQAEKDASSDSPSNTESESYRWNIPALNYIGIAGPTNPSSTTSQPRPLPISIYNAESTGSEVSENFAPYGRLIPCQTIVTIDSAKIETPIIGFVTEDLYHDGRLIIPAGAEVHGKAQTDRSRERIASATQWMVVWRTTDQHNGAELPLAGIALDMERNYANGTWALTDGSAGLRGDIIKSDNLAEIKLFAATFLSAAASGLEDTQQTINPLTGSSGRTAMDSPKNAALQATSSVISEYARQIQDSIKRDGFYVRVPAGKQFYLYVTQTIDLDSARRGQSKLKESAPKERNLLR